MKNKFVIAGVFVIMLLGIAAHSQTSNTKSDSLKADGYDASGVRPCPFTAGDAMKISVYPDSATFPNGVYRIDGEGYVDLPIIGYLKVTDKTVEELTELFKQTYLQFMRYPNLTVRPLMRVSLIGGFRQPGLYYLDPHVSMWEAISTAGVPNRTDGITKIMWERDHAIVQKDIVPHFQSHQSLYQIGFRSGDRLTVTQRPEMTKWEVFRGEMLPLLTFAISTALSAATLYQTYNVLRETRNQ